MFKRLKRKFLIINICSLIATFVTIFGVIIVSSYIMAMNDLNRALNDRISINISDEMNTNNSDYPAIRKIEVDSKGHKVNDIIVQNRSYRYTVLGNRVKYLDTTPFLHPFYNLLKILLISSFPIILIIVLISNYLAKKAVKSIEESIKKESIFMNNVSHELKTPLAIINSNAELIGQVSDDQDIIKESGYIKKQVIRMNAMIKSMLSFAVVKNIGKESYVELNISDILKMIILQNAERAFLKSVEFEEKVEDDVKIRGIEDDFITLFNTLVDNSINYSKGKEIFISLSRHGKSVEMSVKNKGDIPKEDHKNIFDRFYKVDRARTQKNDNSFGLGLSIAKEIVEKYKGKIEVKNEFGWVEFKVTI